MAVGAEWTAWAAGAGVSGGSRSKLDALLALTSDFNFTLIRFDRFKASSTSMKLKLKVARKSIT